MNPIWPTWQMRRRWKLTPVQSCGCVLASAVLIVLLGAAALLVAAVIASAVLESGSP